MVHSECEISQSWRTHFSSHGAFNLNRAVMPPSPTVKKNDGVSKLVSLLHTFAILIWSPDIVNGLVFQVTSGQVLTNLFLFIFHKLLYFLNLN